MCFLFLSCFLFPSPPPPCEETRWRRLGPRLPRCGRAGAAARGAVAQLQTRRGVGAGGVRLLCKGEPRGGEEGRAGEGGQPRSVPPPAAPERMRGWGWLPSSLVGLTQCFTAAFMTHHRAERGGERALRSGERICLPAFSSLRSVWGGGSPDEAS